MDGLYWKEQRRFSLRHMRDYGFGRRSLAVESVVADELQYLLDLFNREPEHDEKVSMVLCNLSYLVSFS